MILTESNFNKAWKVSFWINWTYKKAGINFKKIIYQNKLFSKFIAENKVQIKINCCWIYLFNSKPKLKHFICFNFIKLFYSN